jgi:hypothetical protein
LRPLSAQRMAIWGRRIMPEPGDGIRWFEKTFGTKINAAIKDSKLPISLDLVTAISLQETYYLWVKFYKQLSVKQTLLLCVGDSIGGADGRKPFPTSKAELLAAPNGAKMFAIARESLEAIGKYRTSYKKKADSDPDAFCHGFGIFQNDIQHFKTRKGAGFFLERQWSDFDVCLRRFMDEMKDALAGAGLDGKKVLTDLEMTFVAIVYNMGHDKFDSKKGIKQGHYNKIEKKFYGQYIDENLTTVRNSRKPK